MTWGDEGAGLNLRWIAPLAGILFVVSIVVTFPLNPSPSHNTVAAVSSEFLKHHNRILWGEAIASLPILFFPLFLMGLWARFRGGPAGWLALLAVVTGVAGGVMEESANAVSAALANSILLHNTSHSVLYAIYKVGTLLSDVGTIWFGVFGLAAAAAFLLGPPVRGRWVGWIALIGGILAFISGFGMEDPMFSGVGFAGFIGFIVTLLWILIDSVLGLTGATGVKVPDVPTP